MIDPEGDCPPGLYAKYREIQAEPGYIATYGCCTVCSYPVFLSSIAADPPESAPDGIVRLVWHAGDCEKCAEVSRRAPEVAQWVVNAIETALGNAALTKARVVERAMTYRDVDNRRW